MAILGANTTKQDREYTWTDIGKTTHPIDPIMDWALKAWRKSFDMGDMPDPDWVEVRKMQDAAFELEKMSRNGTNCSCTPVHECHLCNLIAHVMNT